MRGAFLYSPFSILNSQFFSPFSIVDVSDEGQREGSVYGDDLRPLGLEGVSTYPLASRPSKVSVGDFARPLAEDSSLANFLRALPNILAVRSLREIAAQVRRARDNGKPVVWGIGGH